MVIDPPRKTLVTLEDAKVAFNLFCCVFGIGTLGMPANFARAGPLIAMLELVFMASANVYASVVCSKAMLAAPDHVQTFGDLGEWSLGKTGRALVIISQMGIFLGAPCAFLVLGSIILDTLFPSVLSQATWIILMALCVLPVCLIPTLKEGAIVALVGCLGTIVADIVCIGVLVHKMEGHPPVPAPALSLHQVFLSFGNLSLAYGAAIVIPALQRQHSDPARMPRIILMTLTFVSMLFFTTAVSGYSAIGCQITGNLLFSIKGSALGFTANRSVVVIAYLAMQIHITIAFAVILHPSFYILERLLLGMHRQYQRPHQPTLGLAPSQLSTGSLHHSLLRDVLDSRQRAVSSIPVLSQRVVSYADIGKPSGISAAYRGPGVALRFVLLRVLLVVALVSISVALQHHFLELADFIGASAVSLCCIILPIVFYLRLFWLDLRWYERVYGCLVCVVCAVLGCYVSYVSARAWFEPIKP